LFGSSLTALLACGCGNDDQTATRVGASGSSGTGAGRDNGSSAKAGAGGQPGGGGGQLSGTGGGGRGGAGEGGEAQGGQDGEAQGGQGGDQGEPSIACGDGLIEGAETCDDAGLVDGDGCSASCEIEYLLDSGHLDLFEVTYDPQRQGLVLGVKDGTGLYTLNVDYRPPEAVTVDVDAELAGFVIPEDLGDGYAFLGSPGDTIYVLDQTQQDGLPWPGWSSERLLGTLPADADVDLDADDLELAIEVEGPGDVFTFMGDDGVTTFNRYVDTTDDEPDVIPMYLSSHVHTSWVFTELGDYYLSVTPQLMLKSGAPLTGRKARYRFHVGARLVPVQEPPVLTIAGGAPSTYQQHDNVLLTASQEPASALNRYDWYAWGDEGGYALLPGQHGPMVSIHAALPGEFLYSAALLGKTGRIVSVGTAAVTVAEP